MSKSIYNLLQPSATTLNGLTDVNINTPVLNQILKYDGVNWINSSDSLGLTSVGLSMPSVFNVSNSPLTSNGSLSVSFTAQTQHKFLAGDLSNNGLVVFRNIDSSDIPSLPYLTSFNSRTGPAISPATGDYNLTQLGDTNISSLSDKQLLSYDINTSKWLNASYQIYKNYVILSNGQSITASPNTYYDCEGNNSITLPFSYEFNFRVFVHTGDSNTQISINILAGTRLNNINGPLTINSPYGFIEFVNAGQGKYFIVSQDHTWFYGSTPLIIGQTNTSNILDFNINTPVLGQILKYDGTKWANSSDSGLTSVGLSMPSVFSVSNSPLTNNGSISVSFNSQTSHKFLAGDLSNNGTVVFRNIDLTDLPASSFNISNSTNLLVFSASTVNLGDTLTITNVSAGQNLIYAGPNNSSGTPSFRSITQDDLFVNNLIQKTYYINTNVNPAIANSYYNFLFGGSITLNPLAVGQKIKATADGNPVSITLTGGSFILNWSGSGGVINPTVNLTHATIELTCVSISPQVYYNITLAIQHRDTSVLNINGTKIGAINNLENIPNVSISALTSGDILSYNGTNWVNTNPSRCLPTAEIYQRGDTTTYTQNLTVQNTYYIFNDTTTLYANPSGLLVFSTPSNGALKYTGASGKYFHSATSISLSSANAGRSLKLAIFINGSAVAGSYFVVDPSANNIQTSVSFHKVLMLNNNDTIEVKISDITGNNLNITVSNFNFVCMACCN